MMEGEEPLFSIEESKKQLEFLFNEGIINKKQLKALGIRTTVIHEYFEEYKNKINKESYAKIDESIHNRHFIINK